MRIVLATRNAHKVAELQRILRPWLGDRELVAADGPEPVEDGESFAANALIKARAAHRLSGLPALADDSGIAVAALDGAPGIHSARFAGTRDDGDNRRLLLGRMSGVADRRAEFVCAAAWVDDDGGERVETGVWPGVLLQEERGSGGFGYDPIFQPDGEIRSAGELSAAEKDSASHRARAFRALATALGWAD